MGTKNGFSKAQILAIAGGIVSIISVFLPWFSAKASAIGMTSSISVNGLGSVSGSGLLLGLLSAKAAGIPGNRSSCTRDRMHSSDSIPS